MATVSKFLRTNGGKIPDPKDNRKNNRAFAMPTDSNGKRISPNDCKDVHITVRLCLNHRGFRNDRLFRTLESAIVDLLDDRWHGLTGLIAKCLGCSSRHVRHVRNREKKDSDITIRVVE